MRDDYPMRVSDPESEGLPDTADDDSTARDEEFTRREADGPEPFALPADGAVAVDHFGTTAEEQRHGEAIEDRIGQEQPEIPIDNPLASSADPKLAAEADSEEAAAQAQLDADVMEVGPMSDPRSPVSVYDHGALDGRSGIPVGRLLDPDEGAHTDDEPDSVARDAGASGGGATAEELAVHETPPPD